MKEIQLEEMWGKINKALTSENKTFLESKTAKILPNNPTSQGFSADQIRKSLYEGILVLFEWLKTTNNSNVDFNNKVMETLTAINENNEEDKQDLANLKQSLIDGTFNVKYLTWAIMATNDENGNRIIDTYATIERLTQVLEALTQEISDRKAADDLEKNERKEETSAIINSVNQEISDRTNAVSVLNNLITAETENRTSEDEKVLQYAQSVNEALGNAKTDLQGKIDSEAQTRLTSDNEIKASLTSKEDSLKALINSVKNELNGSITTLNNRVNNLPTNYVFDTYESMTNDLLNASNTKYKVGDTLFIKEVNKPDYWVSAILSTKGTYGYYELSIQESKVDLSNYVKISELSREAIEEKFLETVENGRTKSFAARSFAATSRNSGIDLNNYAEYGYDGVSFHKNGMEYPIAFPEKDGILALTDDIPQALKNPFALTINGQVYDGSSAVSITTETITEHDFVRFWHDGIEIQNDGSEHVLRFSDFDTELEEFSPHISCQYDGPQYYWVWKFPQISGTFAMESQIPTKLSQLTNDGNYQTNTSDLKDNTTTFTTASTRSNVASGEKLSVSFGKIAKYFNDLKAVAFSGNKSDIGLGNVDNTSDADKPVSNATQQALNNKANSSDVYTKSETDGLLNNKANKSDVYTKTETDAGLNKSLYNLGYYDTMVENSDGSYTITRQTGYLKLDEVEWWKPDISGTSYTYNIFRTDYTNLNIEIKNNETKWNIICNKYQTLPLRDSRKDVFNTDKAIGGRRDGGNYLEISDSDYNDIDSFKASLHNVYIQYKLATSTTEKVEKNHFARYNERFILEHNKQEAERSSNLLEVTNKTDTSAGVTFTISNGVINVNGSSAESAYPMCEINSVELQAGTYTLSKSIDNSGLFLWVGRNPRTNDIVNTNSKSETFTITTNMIVYISIVSTQLQTYSNFKFSLMLNEGSVALPYQPYEGKVVHEKELGDTLGEKLNSYVDVSSTQVITGEKRFSFIGIDLIKSTSTGEALFTQNATTGDVSLGAVGRSLHFVGNQDRPRYSKDGGVSYRNLALLADIPTFKTINGNSIVGSGDLAITPGIFTKIGNKTNFSFDSGSYLVVANNGLVTITGTDPLNGGSANKKFVGIFMVTIAEYGGGQSVCVNTEEVFLGEAASATISGPMFTIYRLN